MMLVYLFKAFYLILGTAIVIWGTVIQNWVQVIAGAILYSVGMLMNTPKS